MPHLLSNRLDQWLKRIKNQWVIDILKNGYKIPFVLQPSPTPKKIYDLSETHRHAISLMVQKYLDLGTIRVALDSNQTFFSPIFGKEEPAKIRPLFDITHINEFVIKESFKMEGIKSLRDMILPGDFITKMDIKSAYHHVLLHRNSKPSEIPRSSVRHPENVDTFDPGKNKENQKRSPQSHTPSGNGETSNGIKRPVFGSCNCDRACCNQVKRTSTRHNKRPTESQLQLQRALSTLSIYTERSEVVGYPIKPLKLVATDIEDLKSKRTRICYNGCFWNRLGNNKQLYIPGRGLDSEESNRIIKLQRSSHPPTCLEATCASLRKFKSENANRQYNHESNLHERRDDFKSQAIKPCKGMVGNQHGEQHQGRHNPYSRIREYTSGLAIKEFPQTVGMEAAHFLFNSVNKKWGSSKDRFIHISGKSTPKKVLFSNTRPKFNGYRCSRQSLAEIRGLFKPTPTLTTPNSASSSDGNYTDGNYITEMDSAAMVPIITEDGCMPPYDTTGCTPSVGNLSVKNIRESPLKIIHVCLAADKWIYQASYKTKLRFMPKNLYFMGFRYSNRP
ncbi:hypothetical protein AYI69_g9082 [Smittium culicis]|uniref:Reverse transcriptase domain-containing protein n=1 Tax=Smittium culicis TaxID=133412 RepID=A0A1R1XF16_9FUNG|nr:hypothetical protein AYI69_g9082 [Smittium culicis]